VDINQLKTFLEVSRQKSFSRTAQKLSVTQPSISAQIRSLEKFFGYRLLERGGGKVTLTAAGRLFEPFAEDFLTRLNHLQLALGDLERSPRGTLTVSANDSTALYVLPTFFSNFKKQYPRVALNIIRAERSRTLEMVQNREVDFGVVSLPVKDPRLYVEVVHRDELGLVVPVDHPFAERTSVTLEDVAGSRLLTLTQGRRREKLDMLFMEAKLTPRIVMELDSNELLKRLIRAGIGIGFLPRINVVDEVRAGLLRVVEVEGVQLPRALALIFRNDRVLSRAGEAFFTVATGLKRPSLEKKSRNGVDDHDDFDEDEET
jgi:DNA-binding transcriptional LysR family regulator